MRIGSLFAGMGGFDLAAEAMGWSTAWFSEIDPACSHWLAEHWPGVPNHGDITKIDFAQVEPVDMLCGGFPCQPHSMAGKRKASADERDLWPEYERAIRILRPRYVVAENVPGLFTSDGGRFFGRVLGALAALGYDAEWTCLSGADVGAPHERERVWLVADTDRPGRGEQRRPVAIRSEQSAAQYGGQELGDASSGGRGAREGEQIRRSGGGRAGVGDTDRGRREQHHASERLDQLPRARCVPLWDDAVPVRGADGIVRLIPREAAEAGPESPLWPVADGLPGRVARLRAIGNAIIPACAVEIFRAIKAADAVRQSAA